MRHLRKGRKFGRIRGRRQSFIEGLLHNLIMEGTMRTTEARAKEIKPRVERLVTVARKGDNATLRVLLARLPKASAFKLYHEVAPRYKNRQGGYVRIVKTAKARKRDGAPQVVIKFV